MAKLIKQKIKKKQYTSKGYNNIFRFLSYQHQIELITITNPKKVLEIGVGNKFLSTTLKNLGYNVTTCDIDKKLNPNYVCDIRDMPFKDNTFDTVVAFEVLEHLPFSELENSLKEMQRVSKKFCIISVPYPCFNFNLAIKFPLLSTIFHSSIPNFSFRIPKFYQTHSFDGEHYWELGKKGHSKKIIRTYLNKLFHIEKESHPLMNPYHEFFLLKKSNTPEEILKKIKR